MNILSDRRNEMKDIENKITYKDTEYTVVFNLNVMEAIQEKFGSLDAWVDLMDGTANAKEKYKAVHGTLEGFDELDEKSPERQGEPDLKAIKYGYFVMINEGVEIDNENGKETKPVTLSQVGRILTQIGFENAQKGLGELMNDSTQSNEKNE
jgi:hypothetical protein